MKKIKIIKITVYSLMILWVTSCETVDVGLVDNPNAPTQTEVDRDLLLNAIQFEFGNMVSETDLTLGRAVRYDHNFGAYLTDGASGINASRLNDNWRRIYVAIMQDVLIMDNLSADENIPFHLGIAHTLQAFTLLMAVDQWGNIPFTEANTAQELGSEGFNPKLDDGELVYDAALDLLDQAIDELNSVQSSDPQIATDLYFNGSVGPWIKTANTVKLYAYNNLRLVRDVSGEVNSIISNSSNYISSNADDLDFQYSTQLANPDSRHLRFVGDYIASPSRYIGNWLLDEMLNNSNGGGQDPRMRYFFYRQTDTEPDSDDNPCTGNANIDFCYVGGLYRGRDHGDNLGIANDAVRRTAWGLYPIGGRFDDDSFNGVSQGDGAEGAGITPILNHSFVQFMLAELALTEGVTGNPADYLSTAITANFEKVRDFRSDLVDAVLLDDPNDENEDDDYKIETNDITEYVDNVTDTFNGASDDEKLNLIADEFYIAAFGNSIHAYNLYRRTGFPQLQSPVVFAGEFPRSLLYGNQTVNGNSNVSQKQVTQQVFWDNNPAGFID